MLSSILQNPLSSLASEDSPIARDPIGASQELAGLERNRSLYQTLKIPEAVQATETRIQALFRPFNRDGYFLRIASIGQELRSMDERRFEAALDQARNLTGEYAPMLLRGIALDLRKEAEELSRSRQRNDLAMKALEAVASVEIEALHQEGRPQSAERLSHEFQEILGRIAQGLRSGQTILEAVNAERSAHPVSPFVEIYLERGVGSLVSALNHPNLDDWDFSNRLLDYAETLEHGQGLYSGARIIAESLVNSIGEIHQRAQAILNRIPEEAEIDGRYRFILNLGLVTADSNRSVLQLGAIAMSFAAAGGIASAVERGTAAWLTSSGASEATAWLGSSLAHTATVGAIQPLLAPGAERLTWNSYIQQFVHMSGLVGFLGIRSALMRNVAAPTLHYASTIGTMTAYDYATQAEIRELPFALNLINVMGNDLLMRSGETLANLRIPRIQLSDLQVPEIRTFSTRGIALASSIFLLDGCEIRDHSPWTSLVAWLGTGLGLFAMAKAPRRDAKPLARQLNSTNPTETAKGLEKIGLLIASDSLKDNEFALETLKAFLNLEDPAPNSRSVAHEIYQSFFNSEEPETMMVLLDAIGELPETAICELRDFLIPLLDHESEEVAKTTFEALITNGDKFVLPRTKEFTTAVRYAYDRFPEILTSLNDNLNEMDVTTADWLLLLSSYLDDESSAELLRSAKLEDYDIDILNSIDLDFPWRPAEIEFLNNFKIDLKNLDNFTGPLRSIPLTRKTVDQVQAIFTEMWNELNVDADRITINRILDGKFLASETNADNENENENENELEGEDLRYFQDVRQIFSTVLSNTRTAPENLNGLSRLFSPDTKLELESLMLLFDFRAKPPSDLTNLELLEFYSRNNYVFGGIFSTSLYKALAGERSEVSLSGNLSDLFGTALAFAERIYRYGIQSVSYRDPDPSTRQPLLGPESETFAFRLELEDALNVISKNTDLDKHLENLLSQLEVGSEARDKIRLTSIRVDKADNTEDQGFVEGILQRFSLNQGLTRQNRRLLANFTADALTVPASTRETIFSNLFPEFKEILKSANGNLEEAWLNWTRYDATLPE